MPSRLSEIYGCDSLTWSLFSDDSIDSNGKLQEKLAFIRSELKDERKKRIKSAIPVL